MSKHSAKDLFLQRLKASGLMRRSAMKPEVTDGSGSPQQNATDESIPVQSPSQCFQVIEGPPRNVVAPPAVRQVFRALGAATSSNSVTADQAPEANTATSGTPGADSCTRQPERASKSVPSASTTKTAAKRGPNSNGDLLPHVIPNALDFNVKRRANKSGPGNAETSGALSVSPETAPTTTSQGGAQVTASTSVATGNTVEWDERTVEPAATSEAMRDEWVARLLNEVPLGDMQYITSGDSMVLVHHADDGFHVYDLVPRRTGWVPRQPDVTALTDGSNTDMHNRKATPYSIGPLEEIYRMNYDIVDRAKETQRADKLHGLVETDAGTELWVNGHQVTRADGTLRATKPEAPSTEHDDMAEFFFGKRGAR